MTVQQMHDEFRLGLDKVDTLGAPNFLDIEIDSLLNKAQQEFIEQRAWGTNMKKQGLEETQKRKDDLRQLIKEEEIAIFAPGVKPNSFFINLPRDYRHAINEEATIKYICNNKKTTERTSVKPLTMDRYNQVVKDPFNKPKRTKVYRLDYFHDRFEIILGEDEDISSYHLRYLREPATIELGTNTDSQLAEHTHRELVEKAVSYALSDIESPRWQVQKAEISEME